MEYVFGVLLRILHISQPLGWVGSLMVSYRQRYTLYTIAECLKRVSIYYYGFFRYARFSHPLRLGIVEI